MAPADDSLAGELPVPGFGRRDGVGVWTSIGMLLSTIVGMVPGIDVGGEGIIKGVLRSNCGVAPWVDVGGDEKMENVDTESLVVL